ncbi:beta-glucanase [Acrasis kona]|uniref:Beta-glucanase n=1 Tax=Acrasis kona TaxID=1008807 RepID=A0AAW2YK36_9EUKA
MNRLVWSDEFEYNGLPDPNKWSYDVGGHGWGNNESQFYTDSRLDNARVENGKLIITCRKEVINNCLFSSARLVTKHKGDWKYCRVEVRAKIPRGRGTWPAIWMLPTTNTYGIWPNSGEIDIMEHVGFDHGRVHSAIHCEGYSHMKNNQKANSTLVHRPDEELHVYSLEWKLDKIKTFIDGKFNFEVVNDERSWESWPFDHPFHLILNIAVGGAWGGAQGIDDAVFPQTMEIDYVRIYQ